MESLCTNFVSPCIWKLIKTELDKSENLSSQNVTGKWNIIKSNSESENENEKKKLISEVWVPTE